jgi:AraC-like DNA-binding protein
VNGDIAVVPHGISHRISSDPSVISASLSDLSVQRITKRFTICTYGDGDELTTLICACLKFTHPGANSLISLLPQTLLMKAANNRAVEWVQKTVGFMAAEARDLHPGGETVLTRMADILVIHVIRSWVEENPEERSTLHAAFHDPRIGRAITLIHTNPDKEWSVGSLANSVGMSRSSFSARFSSLVGEPVMEYLSAWRMHLALEYLQDRNKSLEEIAALLGYGSSAAFSKAFKRSLGGTPGSFR